jgi:branched-chain amino acid transport system ATP-binding protein
MTTLLEAKAVDAGYHGHPIVQGLDLRVDAGQVVALLGPNGAGKTTTLLTLAGELKPLGGEVWLDGRKTKAPLHIRARNGLAFVTEQRSVFSQLSTAENLRVGRCDGDRALELFPELEPLLRRRGGLLSGGEQQMLTLARALARRPRLLLADELSLGLAPLVVARLLRAVREAADEDGVGVLLVEQHVKQALRIADRVHVMRRGRIVLQGSVEDVRDRLEDAYLTGELVDDAAVITATADPSPKPSD